MTMRTVDPKVKDELWTRASRSFSQAYFSFDRMLGAKRTPKRDAAMVEFFESMLALAYKTGLDQGYDMAVSIFDPEGGNA